MEGGVWVEVPPFFCKMEIVHVPRDLGTRVQARKRQRSTGAEMLFQKFCEYEDDLNSLAF